MNRAFFLILLLLLSCSGQKAASFNRLDTQVAGAAQSLDPGAGLSSTEFARLVERISEPGGYFDTDNLISNERSYLHVLGRLRKLNVAGGAYIGVGPDQNFSYIAQIRPSIAFIIDIRRDNLLQHLFFKALFAQAKNRADFLSLLFGKPPIDDGSKLNIDQIVERLDKSTADRKRFEASRDAVAKILKTFGVRLDEKDLATIGRIHEEFFTSGLELKFTSHNRSARPYYPSFRDLLLEKDLTGKQACYLVAEDDFQFVKGLEHRNLVVPVVGNLAGDRALVEIAKVMKERGTRLSAFYTSNVEYYLMGDGTFGRYADNVRRLPIDDRSMIIRSVFGGGFGGSLPQSVAGYYSSQLLQPAQTLAKGRFDSYRELISQDSLDLR